MGRQLIPLPVSRRHSATERHIPRRRLASLNQRNQAISTEWSADRSLCSIINGLDLWWDISATVGNGHPTRGPCRVIELLIRHSPSSCRWRKISGSRTYCTPGYLSRAPGLSQKVRRPWARRRILTPFSLFTGQANVT